jgi:hypothetical protein
MHALRLASLTLAPMLVAIPAFGQAPAGPPASSPPPPVPAPIEYTLTLTQAEVNVIGTALFARTYGEVAGVINKITGQVQDQDAKRNSKLEHK